VPAPDAHDANANTSGSGPQAAAANAHHPQVDEAIHRRRWWALGVLCLSLVLIVAGNASLNVALPDIQADLGASGSDLQWIVDIYGLIFAGLLLPAGALADRFGRKTALQFGLVVFGAAALVATWGTETWHLITLRGLMGVGAAFIMPGTLAILSNVFADPGEKRRAIAIWAGFAGLGGALGTVVSGIVLRHSGWASTFLVNVPIVVVALLAGVKLLPNSSDPREARLDPVGGLLAMAGLGTLLYAIIEAPHRGWLSAGTLLITAAGLALIAAFVRWELHTDHPMLDVRLFRIRSFAIGSSTITLQFMAMFGLYFALAQWLVSAHGYSPLTTAFIGLPIGVFAMIGAPLSARNVSRFGPRAVVGTGLLVSATGLFLVAVTASATTPVWIIIVGFCLVGLGNGQTTAPSTTLIMSSVPRAKSGVGSAVNDLSRELGGALGIAVLGSVMNSAYRTRIGDELSGQPGSVRSAAGASIDATFRAAERFPDHAEALRQAGRDAFSGAFGRAMLLAVAIALVNAACVWIFQGRRADHVTGEPAVPGGPVAPAEPGSADGSAARPRVVEPIDLAGSAD